MYVSYIPDFLSTVNIPSLFLLSTCLAAFFSPTDDTDINFKYTDSTNSVIYILWMIHLPHDIILFYIIVCRATAFTQCKLNWKSRTLKSNEQFPINILEFTDPKCYLLQNSNYGRLCYQYSKYLWNSLFAVLFWPLPSIKWILSQQEKTL